MERIKKNTNNVVFVYNYYFIGMTACNNHLQ